MLTIAFIDKFPILRTGAEIMLREKLKDAQILTASDVASFQTQHPRKKPDIFILGIESGSIINPFLLIPMIKELYNCPVVIYDDLLPDRMCLKYFSAGATGYVSKCNPQSVLFECLDAVRQNKRYACLEALRVIFNYLPHNYEFRAGEKLGLTGKEHNVAQYLSYGMEISTIADKLHKDISSIISIKRRIFRKLNINSIERLNALIESDGGWSQVPSIRGIVTSARIGTKSLTKCSNRCGEIFPAAGLCKTKHSNLNI